MTGPSFASMLTGVYANQHKHSSNSMTEQVRIIKADPGGSAIPGQPVAEG